ncbi:MAG: bifunctional UDP-3-O-[3-hydroxymyristoyl] N-acetylglucosamine deacetylase/3-hydroxyacyl-ACP dehydratase [Puniceicoccales bacterium]|jgi:UDP-3-O-[3-hydroxymyristoyl] N-acetylglucosamine deacetylase/3-hydroxyacyl-[acyl-carrier-protein] dehydratase|nr:bifunctional UDP-3-O-[3-hydroxymyristoyl] N-acetylglucosamine deacetylase/3-hydroxyacyl-ACP dehydratase [Puniceicoccales bacterium]
MKQHTILRESTISGVSLHTGKHSTITLKPAPPNTGVVFRRVDLVGKPEILATIENVGELVRSTSLQIKNVTISTVEHVLSALCGIGIDNVLVELNADEPPILDGSAKHFVNLILQAEKVEQDAERKVFELREPITVTRGNRSLVALPYDGLKITATLVDDRGPCTQHLSVDISAESFVADIAPARTFVHYNDVEELLKLGKMRGGTIDAAIVIKGDQILSKEPLRFKDEFVRHKILDIVGDISLVGVPVKAHIIAIRPGHSMNAELTREIHAQRKLVESGRRSVPKSPAGPLIISNVEFDINRILNMLPHRYPFVMIDRIVEFIGDDELRAIKNVTVNEPYFVGHFPGQPVMPGVLQVEAMAQAAGLLMLNTAKLENKIAYFMSCDKVKFRQAVTPGDQLEIHVKLTKQRGHKIGLAGAECKVCGKVVSSAQLMFMILDAKER